MKINSIELKHTHPSLGPHEEITIVRLSVSSKTAVIVEKFLKTIQVNHTVSLAEYIELTLSKDEKRLSEITNNGPKGELASGSKISYLTLNTTEGQSITLDDVYRRFSLSDFYPDFTRFMVENGTIERFKPDDARPRKT